jgi:Na+-transporting NADH:ubiquinone oxidoreductase subunit B
MGLRNLVDKIKPTFSEGGKLSFLHSTFEGFETFLFVPNTTTTKGAHIRDCNDIKRVMIVVVLALVPALLMGMYNIGYQAGIEGILPAFWFGFLKMLPMIIVSYVTGLAIEFAFAQKRKHEINEGFLVSGLLIPMVMPITVPLWIVALSTAFAVIIGKEVFGGTGMNVFNPALLARAFAFFAYTPQMSGEAVWYADAKTGATALEQLSSTGNMQWSAMDAFIGLIPGSVGETSTAAILIGAAILLFTGVASWRIMLSVFVGGLAFGYLFDAVGMTEFPAYYHLLVGGFAFGAVFMATDPVTSAQTETGKWIYGFMVGALAVLIRVVNPAYPEGMMLSILFMNALAPLIDYFVVERNIARRKKLIKNVK